MARKKKSSATAWLRTLLWLFMVPLGVWFAAFWVWLYWYDLRAWIAPVDRPRAGMQPALPKATNMNRGRSPTPPKETIFEEDRQKLEEILKRRS